MSAALAFEALGSLDPVSLDEITASADLQTREDRKYLVDQSSLLHLVQGLGQGVRVLAIDGVRGFRYESLYFDTPDLISYLDAAHARPRRFKVRTRSYLDSDRCALEVKTRDRHGRTVKHRRSYAIADRNRLTADGRQWVADIAQFGQVVHRLAPMLTTSYRRTSLLLPQGGGRVTLDVDVVCHQPGGGSVSLPDLVFVETKTTGAPCAVDRVLWKSGSRPVAVSKYCTGLAALHPDLPANRWHRVLRRSFGRDSPSATGGDTDLPADHSRPV
jgi:hypothetical protein